MGYQLENTVTSHKDLVGLLASFLTAEGGWTFDENIDSTERELHVHKTHGGEVFHFSIRTALTDNVQIQGHTGYPAAGSSEVVNLELSSSSMVRAWFFGGDLYCYIIVEVAVGYFQIAGFGRLTPYDAFSNDSLEGAFVFGNDATSSLTVSSSTQHAAFYLSAGSANRNIIRHKPVAGAEWTRLSVPFRIGSDQFQEAGFLAGYYNSDGRRPMLPIRIFVPNNPLEVSGYTSFYPLGTLPDARMINLYQIAITSEETIGSDVWKRFRLPHINPDDTPLSSPQNELGFAFLKS